MSPGRCKQDYTPLSTSVNVLCQKQAAADARRGSAAIAPTAYPGLEHFRPYHEAGAGQVIADRARFYAPAAVIGRSRAIGSGRHCA